MKKYLFALFFATALLMAYNDSDMDGVEDDYDKCPQTPLSELVDYNGCSLKGSGKKIFYDIIFGSYYSQTNYSSMQNRDTINSYIQTDINFERWNFQAIASYYKSETQKGFDDTLLNISYKLLPDGYFLLDVGAGIILPTYDSGYKNEKTDYKTAINFKYILNDKNYLFGGYSHTWIRDEDFRIIKYQDTKSINIGINYTKNSDTSYSISYNISDSIYKDVKAIEILEAAYYLQIDQNWFMGIYYDRGLSSSASDNALGMYIGYYFE